ncbi:Putative AT DNA binding protein [Aspergillus calidoustus]|uniref:Thymocyte nuclear protein 1 n=1 Tax=Aspergillus calidoustus TaxID=454130 RepID=A0A0U5GHT6_ASPCI|nr:Putative AT DNA binding protein [Aspergillus calidoustus]
MALGRKRKSESASVANETTTPSKRVATGAASTPATPATGEKRGRGRPRKYPEGSKPAPPEGPKRGRGRPPKDPAAKGTPKPKTPASSSRGRGRPRKITAQTSASVSTPKTNASTAKTDKSANNSGPSYWLMKAEPESRLDKGVDVKFSIDDLRDAKEPEPWDGVRNAGARNHMQSMKKGDLAFFYHSNCKVPGIAGIMEIVQEHSTDESAFDKDHPYYDEKSKRDNPKWVVVHVEFRRKFENLITLNELKSHANAKGPLENLQMIKQGRLSVSPVTAEEWEFINSLVKKSEDADAAEGAKEGSGAEENAGENAGVKPSE